MTPSIGTSFQTGAWPGPSLGGGNSCASGPSRLPSSAQRLVGVLACARRSRARGRRPWPRRGRSRPRSRRRTATAAAGRRRPPTSSADSEPLQQRAELRRDPGGGGWRRGRRGRRGRGRGRRAAATSRRAARVASVGVKRGAGAAADPREARVERAVDGHPRAAGGRRQRDRRRRPAPADQAAGRARPSSPPRGLEHPADARAADDVRVEHAVGGLGCGRALIGGIGGERGRGAIRDVDRALDARRLADREVVADEREHRPATGSRARPRRGRTRPSSPRCAPGTPARGPGCGRRAGSASRPSSMACSAARTRPPCRATGGRR